MRQIFLFINLLLYPAAAHFSLTGNVSLTYDRVVPCLRNSMHISGDFNVEFPTDAARHYEDLLFETRSYRNVLPHEGPSGYRGPWIENYFIEHFMGKNLSYFNGFIPLFIQWTDIHVADSDRTEPYYNASVSPTMSEFHSRIIGLLRPNVMYLAVSQDDQGLFRKLATERPNILVLSAGGFGHVPIPLIKGEIPAVAPPETFHRDVGFYGSIRPRLSRSSMLSEIEGLLQREHLKYMIGPSNEWSLLIQNTKFNLAPRGYGRTSYRLAEIIQIGRTPVYIYDDYSWLPYEGTELAISNFGFSGRMGSLAKVVAQIKDLSVADYKEKMRNLARARQHYTYAGVLAQIALFIQDPLGPSGGQLRCTRVPDKEHR